MSAIRPLPPRPSLEHARKEAKALLRRLRAGDPEALARARARHPGVDIAHARLADGDVERQQHGHVQLHGGLRLFEAHARDLLAGHRAGGTWALRAFAAYVPRFYGAPLDSNLHGMPIVNVAVANAMTPVVECLVRCGASLDVRGWRSASTARELASGLLEGAPDDTNRGGSPCCAGWTPTRSSPGRGRAADRCSAKSGYADLRGR